MKAKAPRHTFKIYVPLDILTPRLYSKALRIELVREFPTAKITFGIEGAYDQEVVVTGFDSAVCERLLEEDEYGWDEDIFGEDNAENRADYFEFAVSDNVLMGRAQVMRTPSEDLKQICSDYYYAKAIAGEPYDKRFLKISAHNIVEARP